MAQGMVDGVLVEVPDLPVVVMIPQVLSRAQFKLSLIYYNLFDLVEGAVAVAPLETQIKYKEASWFERNNVSLNTMATTLGITQAQMDAIFVYGHGLQI